MRQTFWQGPKVGLVGEDVDPNLVMLLGEIPPVQVVFDQLERIGTWEKVIAWAQARQCAEISRFVTDAVLSVRTG